jgi:hypothetical protein
MFVGLFVLFADFLVFFSSLNANSLFFFYDDRRSLSREIILLFSLVACLWLRLHQVDSLFPFLHTLLFVLLVFMAHAYAIINF